MRVDRLLTLSAFPLLAVFHGLASVPPGVPLTPSGVPVTSGGKSSPAPGRYVRELQFILRTQPQWVKVHAAEYLLRLGYPDGVREAFLDEERRSGSEPRYRIGIWRVLARTASGEERERWTQKILNAFLDTSGTDRLHAAETLAKLGISVLKEGGEAITRQALEDPDVSFVLYTRWSVAYTSADSLLSAKRELLTLLARPDETPAHKRQAVYILRWLGDLTVEQWKGLAALALRAPAGSSIRPNLLSSAWMTAPTDGSYRILRGLLRRRLMEYRDSSDRNALMEGMTAMAEKGSYRDTVFLHEVFEANGGAAMGGKTVEVRIAAETAEARTDAEMADLRATAAFALCRIAARRAHPGRK